MNNIKHILRGIKKIEKENRKSRRYFREKVTETPRTD